MIGNMPRVLCWRPWAFLLPPAPAARPRVVSGAAPAPSLPFLSGCGPGPRRLSGGGRPSGGAPCPAAVAGAVVPPLWPVAFGLVVRSPAAMVGVMRLGSVPSAGPGGRKEGRQRQTSPTSAPET